MIRRDIHARVWALVAALADERDADVGELLDGLDGDDLVAVVTGLAALAMCAFTPPGLSAREPHGRAGVVATLRCDLLRLAQEPNGNVT